MSYLDRYKNRLARKGDNVGDVYENNTINFIEAKFSDSPTFKVVGVISTQFPTIKQIDTRVVLVERMGTLREVLFRPNQGLNIGTYLIFDNQTWLIIDQWGDRNSTKYSCLVQKCNRTIKWKDINGAIQELYCIASQSPLGSKAQQGKFNIEFNKFDVSLPTGQLFVFSEYNNLTKGIKLNHRFFFGRNVYEVIGIDGISFVDSGFGIMQFTVKLTTLNDKDDTQNHIAFNNYNVSSINDISTIDEQGGRIW